MHISRLFAGVIFIAMAGLSSACGFGGGTATQTTTVTVTASPTPTAVAGTPAGFENAVRLYPAADMVGALTKTEWGLSCQAGLKSVELMTFRGGASIGATRVLIDNQYTHLTSSNTTSKTLFTFQGPIPEVKGVYVTTFDNPINPDGSYADPIKTDYPVLWSPGMEKALSIDSRDFGYEDVSSVTLCIDQ